MAPWDPAANQDADHEGEAPPEADGLEVGEELVGLAGGYLGYGPAAQQNLIHIEYLGTQDWNRDPILLNFFQLQLKLSWNFD